MATSIVRSLLALAVVLSWGSPAVAADRMFVLEGYRLPAESQISEDVEIADFDGDFDLDIVFANRGGNRLVLNRGDGFFDLAPGLPATGDTTMALDAADVDGDGDLDLASASYYAPVRLYLSDGLGQFTEVSDGTFPLASRWGDEVVFGDVDGDGDQDLFVGRVYEDNLLLVNDGAGHFADETAARLPLVADPLANAAYGADLGDVDGDGDLDLYVANHGSQDRLYLNDGAGFFEDVTAASLPVDAAASTYALLVDLDHDRDLDVLVATRFGQERLYLNDGNGVFSDATGGLPLDAEWTEALTVRDVDGDGDEDVVCSGYPGNKLWLNDGTTHFTDVSATRLPYVYQANAAAFGDLDGDGREELVFAVESQDVILANDGSGVFTNVTIANVPMDGGLNARDVAVGDLNGDGLLDVAIAGSPSAVYLADGRGGLVPGPGFSGAFPGTGVALADIDRDGDLDVFLADAAADSLHLNDGRGGFTDATGRLPVHGVAMGRPESGDVNGDGFPDLVVARYGLPQLFLNDGTGAFTDAGGQLPGTGSNAHDVAVVDVDGDGHRDLILAVYQGQSRVFLNDGNGWFTDATATSLPPASHDAVSIATGDVDGDGDVDFVLGLHNHRRNRLFLNGGAGVFADVTDTHMPAIYWGHSFGVALGDVDGDGDLDLAVGNHTTQNYLHLNDGSGHFTDVTAEWLPVDGDGTFAACFVDPDADGDLDLVFAGEGQTRLYTNVLLVPPNRAPVALDQAVTTPEDQPVAVTLAATDPDGDPLTYAVVAGPSFGTLSGAPPNLVYTPGPDYSGADAFTFAAADAALWSSVATVSITVAPVNDAPVAAAGPDRQVKAKSTITFGGASSYDVDGTIVSWAWSFGDGTSGTGRKVTKQYATTGTYTVTLTVTDDQGATGLDTATVVVRR